MGQGQGYWGQADGDRDKGAWVAGHLRLGAGDMCRGVREPGTRGKRQGTMGIPTLLVYYIDENKVNLFSMESMNSCKHNTKICQEQWHTYMYGIFKLPVYKPLVYTIYLYLCQY